MTVIEQKPVADVRAAISAPPPADPDAMVKITLTIPQRDVKKVHAWMSSDTHEKARAIREADLSDGAESIAELLRLARGHGYDTSGGRAAATLLASLYNGARVKFDVSDLKLLDSENFEHAMKAMRVCYAWSVEPHQFFKNGGDLFEHLIKTYGLEKKRRTAR